MSERDEQQHHQVDDIRTRAPVGRSVGSEAIKWGAVVVIVFAILWFLAQYIIPLVQ